MTNLSLFRKDCKNFFEISRGELESLARGDWIVFTSERDGDEQFRIYLIRPEGTGVHKLTHSPGDAHCTWSPDGSALVFTSARMGFKDERVLSMTPQPYGELFTIRVDGTDLRQLTDNQWEDGTPIWFSEKTEKSASTTARRDQ